MGRLAARLPSGRLAGLVNDPHQQAAQRRSTHFGQAAPQFRPVVVAPAGEQSLRPLLKLVEQGRFGPITGVHHHIGRINRLPHLHRQLLCPRWQMSVGDQ